MEVDKDVVVPKLRYFSLFIVAKAIEAILSSDGPLFGCRWYHGRYITKRLDKNQLMVLSTSCFRVGCRRDRDPGSE